MTTTSVWVQLYYEGKGQPEGQPTEVEGIPKNTVDALKKAVKKEFAEALTHCSAATLKVYMPGMAVPVREGSEGSLKPWDAVPTKTIGENPLIVVAPEKQQQQPQLSETVTGGLELMVNDYLAKKRTIVLSETSRATKNDLIEMLGLAEKGASWSGKPAVLPHIDGFSWRKGPEDSTENRKAYMAYLEEMLQIPAHYALADVQPNRTLLQVELFRELPETRNISGTTDVVIAKAQHICNQAIRNNIETLLELKKPQNLQQKDHTPQMIGEHIGASYLNRHHAVVSVLTDLNRAWTFCWFARGLGDSDDSNQEIELYRLCLDGGQAAADAKYLLDSLYDKNSVAEDTLPSTFANRLPFQAVLDSFVKNNKRVRREFDRADSSDSADLDSKKPSPFGGGVAGGQHPPTVGTDASGSGTAPENNQGAAVSGGGGDAPTMSMASALSLFARPTDRDVANELDLLDMVDDVNEQYEIVRSFAEKHIVPYMRGG